MDDAAAWVRAMMGDLESEKVNKGVEKLERYQGLLASWSEVHNLTGLDKSEHLQTLLMPSVAVASALENYDCVLDLGTGAGIPGFVAALFFPDQYWILVERCQKKVAFLRQAKHLLAANNVEILGEDFTQMLVDSRVKAVVSRGSAKFNKQVELTKKWRQQGIPLYSIQTHKSLVENSVGLKVEVTSLPGEIQGGELILVCVQ